MVRRSSRLALAAGALEAWGFRPASARAAQQDYDDVLLSQDLQAILLDTVGLNGIGLGAICKSWAAVVAGRRAKEWNVLKALMRRGGLDTATSVSFVVDSHGVIRWVHPGPRVHRDPDGRHAPADRDFRALEALVERWFDARR